jgi:hypothetical protein
MTDSVIARIEKAAIIRVIHQEPTFAETFIAHLLGRNIRVESDLVDQLFNSSEKRLARMLLLLANFGKESKPEPIIAKISQETLAEMIGTTRSRVSFFMNKFRELGFIDYNGSGLEVHTSCCMRSARSAAIQDLMQRLSKAASGQLRYFYAISAMSAISPIASDRISAVGDVRCHSNPFDLTRALQIDRGFRSRRNQRAKNHRLMIIVQGVRHESFCDTPPSKRPSSWVTLTGSIKRIINQESWAVH